MRSKFCAEYETERDEATMKEQETRTAMLDDGKVDLTRKVEMLSRKHMKSEDFITQQIHMLELMRGGFYTIRLVQEKDIATVTVVKQRQRGDPNLLSF